MNTRRDLDNVNEDYVSSHNILYVPMNVNQDKNEIMAMKTLQNFNKTFSKFKDIVDTGRKGRPLFQDLWKSNRHVNFLRSKKKRNKDISTYDYMTG
jgi:glutathione peroxidase-family protein